jgi:hypothetical protein
VVIKMSKTFKHNKIISGILSGQAQGSIRVKLQPAERIKHEQRQVFNLVNVTNVTLVHDENHLPRP